MLAVPERNFQEKWINGKTEKRTEGISKDLHFRGFKNETNKRNHSFIHSLRVRIRR